MVTWEVNSAHHKIHGTLTVQCCFNAWPTSERQSIETTLRIFLVYMHGPG